MKKEILLITIFIFLLFLVLYFSPFQHKQFNFLENNKDSNFALNNSEELNLFYPNMRFPLSNISYKIYNCEKDKIQEINQSFQIIQNLSVLKFYPIKNNEQISIFCEEKKEDFNQLYVAGEGGPTEITVSGNFKIIKKGEIHLIKKSDCDKPNIVIHELFHVLGFNHSINKEDIMYNVTNCNQKINPLAISYLNDLYSIPSLSDLEISNVSVVINGRFLDLNSTVKNTGIISSNNSTLFIYEDGKIIETFNLGDLCEGCSKIISIGNVWINSYKTDNLSLEIKTNEKELNEENNKIKLN
ncbi:matrixin family metalloprotease [Candidatus Woesearchaeota archaeon]|jgi:hypothetical protein|nr:matrixin family metalloprotease [Candidatus Woesearchaeota archaeon]